MHSYIISFFIAWAMARICQISTRNIITVVFFILGLRLVKYTDEIKFSKGKNTARVFGGLFSILYLCGDFEKILDGLENKLFCFVILVVTGVGLFFLFYKMLYLFFYKASSIELKKRISTKINLSSNGLFGVVVFMLCIIFWMPYLLKNFPGIMTVDSINQYAQIIGVWEQNNHHPWIHTLIIKLFYNLGLLLVKDATLAIAFYTVVQMIFMAFCVAYFMVFLKSFSLSTWIYLTVLSFYLLVPYQGIYAISMIKDAPFAGFCLLYTISIFKLLLKKEQKLSLKEDWKSLLMMFISGVFFCLFRTNGFYAFLVLIPFILVTFRKNIKTLVVTEALILLTVLIIKGPVMSGFGISQPDLVENLSMPGQQLSRVIMNDRELTYEEEHFLNTIMDVDRMQEGYNPYVSDWFKRLVREKNQKYLQDNFLEFVKIYIGIGLRYPGDYLIAYRDQTIGYWFPCTDQMEIAANEGIVENEFGISTIPVIKGNLVVKINEIALKLHTMLPGIGILWSIGAILWIIVVFMLLGVIRNREKSWILYLPALAIFFTLLLSTPVAYDFRYAYGYVYCLPLYILLPFISKKK